MCRVERIRNVHCESYLGRVRTVSVEPLACDVDGGFAAIGGLGTELKRFERSACAVRDEFDRDLAGHTMYVLPSGEGAEGPIRLAKRHD